MFLKQLLGSAAVGLVVQRTCGNVLNLQASTAVGELTFSTNCVVQIIQTNSAIQ